MAETVKIDRSHRLDGIGEYYFSRRLREIGEIEASTGRQIIKLAMGSPDLPPHQSVIDRLSKEAQRPDVHKYMSYKGEPILRKAFADWYKKWYRTELDYQNEVLPLIGSKEGILLISLAFLDKGDKVLVPDPGYPTYSSASRLVEAEILAYDLKAENGWKPDFEALEKMDLSGVKIMWTNYPNMPTGAPATEDLYAELVAFGKRHGILICNDNPYSFILNDSPLSILAQPGAKECCLELNSLSKAHNMAGWRIGMVAADAEVISQILKVKSQMDSGMFKPLQLAAVKALEQGSGWFTELNDEYRRRRVLAGAIFDMLGVEYDHSSAGMFLWGKVPQDVQATEEISIGQVLSDRILYDAGVFITPGFIFGKNGEDYIRISLCAKPETLREAAERIRQAGINR